MKGIVTFFVVLIWYTSGLGQTVHITGEVRDSLSREPLADVTVKYGEVTTKTDQAGKFVIERKTDLKIVAFNHLGYRKTMTDVSGKNNLVVLLFPMEHVLDEVVVSTGYQSFDKNTSTGSYIRLSKEQIANLPQEDFLSRMDGFGSGVLLDRPADGNGQNTMFTIRGISTMGGVSMSRPLIVLDGFPYEGDPNAINPNDIENITVLKDAAASAIWGVRAGNGVVVITTKTGGRNGKVSVDINTLTTITDGPQITSIPRIKSADYIDIERMLFENGRYTTILNNRTTRPAVTPAVELLYQNSQETISKEQLEAELNRLAGIDVYDQLSKYVYRKMVKQQSSANISWGNSMASNYLSVGYDRNSTTLRQNGTDRLTLRNQFNVNPTPRLSLTATLQLAQMSATDNNRGMNMLNSNISMYPYAELIDAEGQNLAIPYQYRETFLDTLYTGLLHDWSYRPLGEIRSADNTSSNLEWMATADLSYKIWDGFKLSAKYQYARQENKQENIYDTNTFYARDLINRYSQVSNGEVSYIIPNSGIRDGRNSLSESHSLRFQLDLDRKISELINLRAAMGNEIRFINVDGNSFRTYGYERNFNNLPAMDYISTYPIIANLSAASKVPFSDALFGTRTRFLSFYMNTDMTFAERYSLSFSARRDASNLFGVRTSQRWNPLWSVGGAWSIVKEEWGFFDAFDNLRLRMTYGKSGNVNPNLAGRTVISYNSIRSSLNRLQYALVRNPPDEDLRWETVSTWNTGIDLGFKNLPLSLSVEGYVKDSKDLFALVSSDPTIGFGSITKNSARMQNKGIEITANIDYSIGFLQMRTSLNNTFNSSKIKSYYYKRNRDTDVLGGTSSLQPVENYSAYSVFAYRWGGLSPQSGDPQGFLNGELSVDYNAISEQSTLPELKYMGTSVPRSFWGLTQDFRWRSIYVSLLFTWRLGHVFRSPTVNYSSMVTSGSILHSEYYDRWQAPGDESRTNVPSFVYPANSSRDLFYQYADINVEKGDVLRLQHVRLGYSPFSDGRLKGIKFTAVVNNIGILWKASDRVVDPDYSIMPPSRSYSVGLNWNF